ncbi:MAG: PriCT-2 domain-containing protein, partial [Prevotella sp.]|nr:PriCT-2 domain-containing protein [Prevotella sp.]
MDRYDYQALVNEVVTRGINMFENFDDWTKGAFALSNLGENGRAMFKSISKLSSRYNEAENNRKFTNALHTNNKVGIASFIYMCRQY